MGTAQPRLGPMCGLPGHQRPSTGSKTWAAFASHTRNMVSPDVHLHIGSLLFEGFDQIDLTGPFEVLSRIPNSTYRIFAKTVAPVPDVRGLRLMPDATLAQAPQLDLLHVPGGFGQEALMEDDALLD